MTNLYVLGEILDSDAKAIAVVGSRKISVRGRRLTESFVKSLVKAGFTIVSGLARGVDTLAHMTALAFGGRTIAVLGSGIDVIYPPENKNLAAKIVKNGALVSGFAKGTPPYAKNFLARNKIVAGLSKSVLVIEGARRSGTLSTASWAANFGLDVYAVPGCVASDWLIGEGAIKVITPQDLLDKIE